MAFTEFYCDFAAGSQMNGGAPIGGIYPKSYTNGGWNSGTGVFTPAAGNPQTDGITVGDFASVYVDGATTPSFVGRVTARNSTTITVSITIKIGTIPTTGASGLTCTVGGAWKGPNAADNWPIGSVTTALINASNNPPRINLKNGTTYDITAVVTNGAAGVTVQGYTSSAGDGGKATIDGSTNAIVLYSSSGAGTQIIDVIVSNNGSSGSNNGITVGGANSMALRCVAHDIRGVGINVTANPGFAIECETYLCNTSNTSSLGGFSGSATPKFIRCVSHDNAGSNNNGFVLSGSNHYMMESCIADSNGAAGVLSTGAGHTSIRHCDVYNNASHGINVNVDNITVYIENCNILKNGSAGTVYGISAPSNGARNVNIVNCAYGSGTMANRTAATNGTCIQETGAVTYASNVDPWTDPDNGDFRINLAAAIGAGRGTFTETQASYTGSAGAPVIGACQVADYPGVANVNSGTTYANAAYTGTLTAGGVVGSRIFVGF